MKNNTNIILFALNGSHELGKKIADNMLLPLSEHEEKDFEDGEHKSRPMISVRNKDVYVIQSLFGDENLSVHDKLCRLLFFIGALRDASAGRVTAVVPYLCYARKDRKTKARDPVTTRYIASLFEALGTDRVITIDIHNLQAYQNAFRCRTEHLEAKKIFIEYVKENIATNNIAIMSPDIGGVKRAEQFRQGLAKSLHTEIPFIFMEKQRNDDIVSGETIVGNAHNKTVLILDDMISSGTTLLRAANACHDQGAKNIYAFATHGLFVEKANKILKDAALDKIIITNTVARHDCIVEIKNKLIVLDVAPLFAEAIHRIHSGDSLVDLLDI